MNEINKIDDMAKKNKRRMPVIMSDANQHIRERAERKEKQREYIVKKMAELRARQMAEYEANMKQRETTTDAMTE